MVKFDGSCIKQEAMHGLDILCSLLNFGISCRIEPFTFMLCREWCVAHKSGIATGNFF